MLDTGAWKEGTMIYDDYSITVTCPEAGQPDPECEWRTSYVDPREEQDLFVGFLELGPDHYLQIEIMGVTEVNTPPYMFLENEDFQNCFRIEFEKTK